MDSDGIEIADLRRRGTKSGPHFRVSSGLGRLQQSDERRVAVNLQTDVVRLRCRSGHDLRIRAETLREHARALEPGRDLFVPAG